MYYIINTNSARFTIEFESKFEVATYHALHKGGVAWGWQFPSEARANPAK